jgi:hypothetical protein
VTMFRDRAIRMFTAIIAVVLVALAGFVLR